MKFGVALNKQLILHFDMDQGKDGDDRNLNYLNGRIIRTLTGLISASLLEKRRVEKVLACETIKSYTKGTWR